MPSFNLLDRNDVPDDNLIAAIGQRGLLEEVCKRYGLRCAPPSPGLSPPPFPLGLMPRYSWDAQRMTDILGACDRYVTYGKQIPQAWLDELEELNRDMGKA